MRNNQPHYQSTDERNLNLEDGNNNWTPHISQIPSSTGEYQSFKDKEEDDGNFLGGLGLSEGGETKGQPDLEMQESSHTVRDQDQFLPRNADSSQTTPRSYYFPSYILEKGLAMVGVWALSLITASQINKFIVESGGYDSTEELWNLRDEAGNYIVGNCIGYYFVIGMLIPFCAGGLTGYQSNAEENKGIFSLTNLGKLPGLAREHIAATVIIICTAIMECLILASCIQDFFQTNPEKPLDDWQIGLSWVLGGIGALQYVLVEGKELIKRMSKENKENDEWYENFLLGKQKGWRRNLTRFGIGLLSYGISYSVVVGYFALAYGEGVERIKKIANPYTSSEDDAADWANVIAVPLTLMYNSMYCSLYAYRSQKQLRNIIASSKFFSSSSEPNLENFWNKYKNTIEASVDVNYPPPVEVSDWRIVNCLRTTYEYLKYWIAYLRHKNTQNKSSLIGYIVLCIINALGEGAVLMVSIQGLVGNSQRLLILKWALGIYLLLCGFLQNFLVEGAGILKIRLKIEEKDHEQIGKSIYPPDKFFVDVIQFAALVMARLAIESWLLPENMKIEDETPTKIANAYLFSAMICLLSTYMFIEFPRYIYLLNASEEESSKTKSFASSKGRLFTQGLIQLLLPIPIGLIFERLFFSYFAHERGGWKALNDAQIVGSISTGLVAVILRKIVDYCFEEYYKQPAATDSGATITCCSRLGNCTTSVLNSINPCAEEENTDNDTAVSESSTSSSSTSSSSNPPNNNPIKVDESELRIPADNSCLFWAVALGVLIPVLDDEYKYQQAFNQLFVLHDIYVESFARHRRDLKECIRTFLNSNDPNSLKGSIELIHLLRLKVHHYMVTHRTDYEEMLVAEKKTFENYSYAVLDPNFWGGHIEIYTMFHLLNENYQIEIENSGRDPFLAPGKPVIRLIYTNAGGDRSSSSKNHYNLRMPNITQIASSTEENKDSKNTDHPSSSSSSTSSSSSSSSSFRSTVFSPPNNFNNGPLNPNTGSCLSSPSNNQGQSQPRNPYAFMGGYRTSTQIAIASNDDTLDTLDRLNPLDLEEKLQENINERRRLEAALKKSRNNSKELQEKLGKVIKKIRHINSIIRERQLIEDEKAAHQENKEPSRSHSI